MHLVGDANHVGPVDGGPRRAVPSLHGARRRPEPGGRVRLHRPGQVAAAGVERLRERHQVVRGLGRGEGARRRHLPQPGGPSPAIFAPRAPKLATPPGRRRRRRRGAPPAQVDDVLQRGGDPAGLRRRELGTRAVVHDPELVHHVVLAHYGQLRRDHRELVLQQHVARVAQQGVAVIADHANHRARAVLRVRDRHPAAQVLGALHRAPMWSGPCQARRAAVGRAWRARRSNQEGLRRACC
mmetsp:Transcript_27513/g.93941  ORF Transcript_27513/g.93941 Transcript_27513/m.93941 type:complete len:240 (-) Transcript_27513:125-844(-)